MNENIQPLSVLSWFLKSRPVLIQKDLAKGNVVGNYQPKPSVNLLWKLKTDIVGDKLYQHLENDNLILEEQNGC